jgi:hypothetical protein
MIGIFLIYFLGRAFYDLAFEYNKHQWGYAILGVVSYYTGTFVGGLVLVLGAGYLFETDITTYPDMAINLMAVPFGLLGCWGLYRILKSNWKKKTEVPEAESVLDSNLNSVENQ